jgi:hypothetical protein
MIEQLSALLTPPQAQELTKQLTQLVRDEVASKSGIAGVGIKAAFGALNRVKPDLVDRLVAHLLPSFIEAFSPLYEEFLTLKSAGSASELAAFMKLKSAEVAQALLSVTDRRAEAGANPTLVKVYKKLRPIAEAQVIAAVPAVARVLQGFGL